MWGKKTVMKSRQSNFRVINSTWHPDQHMVKTLPWVIEGNNRHKCNRKCGILCFFIKLYKHIPWITWQRINIIRLWAKTRNVQVSHTSSAMWTISQDWVASLSCSASNNLYVTLALLELWSHVMLIDYSHCW